VILFNASYNASYNSKEPFWGRSKKGGNPFSKAVNSVTKSVKKATKVVSKGVVKGFDETVKGIEKGITFTDDLWNDGLRHFHLDNDGPIWKLKKQHKCAMKKMTSSMKHNNNYTHYSNNEIIKKYCEVE